MKDAPSRTNRNSTITVEGKRRYVFRLLEEIYCIPAK
jgi:hypothetical protein